MSSSLFPLCAGLPIHPEWRGLFYSNDRLTRQWPLIFLARAKPRIFLITCRDDHDWNVKQRHQQCFFLSSELWGGPGCVRSLLIKRSLRFSSSSPLSFHHVPLFLLHLMWARTSSCLQPRQGFFCLFLFLIARPPSDFCVFSRREKLRQMELFGNGLGFSDWLVTDQPITVNYSIYSTMASSAVEGLGLVFRSFS